MTTHFTSRMRSGWRALGLLVLVCLFGGGCAGIEMGGVPVSIGLGPNAQKNYIARPGEDVGALFDWGNATFWEGRQINVSYVQKSGVNMEQALLSPPVRFIATSKSDSKFTLRVSPGVATETVIHIKPVGTGTETSVLTIKP